MRAGIFLSLLLAGCSTASVLDNEPFRTFTSVRSADALEECIGVGLADLGGPKTIHGEGRRTLTFGADQMTVVTVSISENEPRIIELRKRTPLGKKWLNRLRACAG